MFKGRVKGNIIITYLNFTLCLHSLYLHIHIYNYAIRAYMYVYVVFLLHDMNKCDTRWWIHFYLARTKENSLNICNRPLANVWCELLSWIARNECISINVCNFEDTKKARQLNEMRVPYRNAFHPIEILCALY